MPDSPTPAVVIGIGNSFRRDDGVGLYVAEKIEGRNIRGVEVVCGVADGTAMMSAWTGRQLAIVIDCVMSDSLPGTVHRFDGLTERLPEKIFSSYSSHCFGVRSTIELAQNLGSLPDRLQIFGIEGHEIVLGPGLTPEVRRGADRVTREIAKLLSDGRFG